MKILLNNTAHINNFQPNKVQHEFAIKNNEPETSSALPPKGLQLAQFHNVSFGLRAKPQPDIDFLLSYADRFKCAYSGKSMISKPKAKEIYQKLDKRPNAQSAINLLQHLQGYMHNIESIVFDLLCDASYKSKRDFQDILQEFVPNSLEQLKIKQVETLNKTNNIVNKLSEPVAQKVIAVRDEALAKIENDTFGRKIPLEKIKAIKAEGKDLQNIIKIYRKWYKLPASSNDLDAFIVQYSKKSHTQIAKRLISSAVASVEHVKPHSMGGNSRLSNLLLVSAQFNNTRSTMPLWEYIMLNPEMNIRGNLQKYMDEIIKEVSNKKSAFFNRGYYPEKIKKVIAQETNSMVQLNTNHLHLTKEQQRDNSNIKKLAQIYTLIEK